MTAPVEAFNSLSRDHAMSSEEVPIAGRIRNFQLPLSGSPGPRSRSHSRKGEELSTPSLGITGNAAQTIVAEYTTWLSTPSLGITNILDVPAFISFGLLSTPSLGITQHGHSDCKAL